MAELKEVVNVRLSPADKRTLNQLARQRNMALGELLRDIALAYIAERERATWETEARRQAERYRAAYEADETDEEETTRWLEGMTDGVNWDR